jgi:hypothetical protein
MSLRERTRPGWVKQAVADAAIFISSNVTGSRLYLMFDQSAWVTCRQLRIRGAANFRDHVALMIIG